MRLLATLVMLAVAACDSVESARERADASYDEARGAAAAAGVYLPPRTFVERHGATPPPETAPWVVTIARDEMRGLDRATACTSSTNDVQAILCVEERVGEEIPVVSVEIADRIDCTYDCEVAARFGDTDVVNIGIGGERSRFTLQRRRGVDWWQRVAASDVVFVEAPVERGNGARQQMRFDTRRLTEALAWRPAAEDQAVQ